MTDHADLIARLRAGPAMTLVRDEVPDAIVADIDRHLSKYQALCDEAADALSRPIEGLELSEEDYAPWDFSAAQQREKGNLGLLINVDLYLAMRRDIGRLLSRPPVTEEMVERAISRAKTMACPPFILPSEMYAILTAALGTPAAGHETYPGHDPAAGLPQPDAAGGAESLVCAACGGLLREDCGQAANARFSGKPSPCVPMQSFNEASIRAEATAKERERCAGRVMDAYNEWWRLVNEHSERFAAWKRGGEEGPMPDSRLGSLPDYIAAAIRGGSHD